MLKQIIIYLEYFICEDFTQDRNLSLFGVLDGHGGIHVVDFCRREIPRVNKSNFFILIRKIISLIIF